MNTTYDTNFRLRSLLDGVTDTLHQWRRSEPTLHTIANSVKSWQNDWETLHNIMMRQGQKTAYKSQSVRLSFDEAWHNRDNRNLAIKAVDDALNYMKEVASEAERDDFVPVYKRRSVKAAFGDHAYNGRSETYQDKPVEARVKSWAIEARNQIDELQNIPQNNRQYIGFNPHLEGSIYQRHTMKAKAWLRDNASKVMADLTPQAKSAIKAIDDRLSRVYRLSNQGVMDPASRREIHAALRQAYKMVDHIQPETRTPAVKAALFQDVDALRSRIDNIMPLLDHGRYDESDLYRDVTEAIQAGRNIAQVAPVKFMPSDTHDNFYNLDRSLSQVIVSKNNGFRIKALRAAAANLDVIARDLAGIEGLQVIGSEYYG